MMPFKTHL